ncbi:MAG: hypothetical protein QXH20_06920, partial [Candidatus Bathyarchaeia archaeon]
STVLCPIVRGLNLPQGFYQGILQPFFILLSAFVTPHILMIEATSQKGLPGPRSCNFQPNIVTLDGGAPAIGFAPIFLWSQ